VKQAAYDVQRSKWSQGLPVLDRDGRLAYAKTMSATPGPGRQRRRGRPAAGLDRRRQSLGLTPRARPRRLTSPSSSGAWPWPPWPPSARPATTTWQLIDAVMAEPASAMCLNMGKLNLYQCLAVAKPHYEDVFCLGQHIMIDTGVRDQGVGRRDALRAAAPAQAGAGQEEAPWPRRPPRSRPPRRRAKRLSRQALIDALQAAARCIGRPFCVWSATQKRRPGETIQSCAAASHFESTGLSRETRHGRDHSQRRNPRPRRHRRFARNPPPRQGPRRSVRRPARPR
jgi:hypothetical protein